MKCQQKECHLLFAHLGTYLAAHDIVTTYFSEHIKNFCHIHSSLQQKCNQTGIEPVSDTHKGAHSTIKLLTTWTEKCSGYLNLSVLIYKEQAHTQYPVAS